MESIQKEPFTGISNLETKINSAFIFFTDRKIIINGLVYADFAKPMLLSDMDYIFQKLYQNVKYITYTLHNPNKKVNLPDIEDDTCYLLFRPTYMEAYENFVADSRYRIPVTYSILLVPYLQEGDKKVHKYLCPYQKTSDYAYLQELFSTYTCIKELLSSFACGSILMASTIDISRVEGG